MAKATTPNWKIRQLQAARKAKALKRKHHPKPRKHRKDLTRKQDFLEALRGTGGVRARIAANLGVQRSTVTRLLEREGWDDVRRAWLDEIETTTDLAEETLRDAMAQRLDIGTASANARWYLSKVQRERFGENSTVTVEGGANAIKHVHGHVNIGDLNLPVDVKRTILEALEAKEHAGESEAGAAGTPKQKRLPAGKDD